MPTDLLYVALTAVMTASLWIPYIVCQVMTNGPLRPTNYRDPTVPRPVPAWGTRAQRVHLNAVENFAPFAALVILAHIAGKGGAVADWAAAYFWLRLAHAIVYWLAIPYVRTVIFTLAWLVTVIIFVVALT